MISLLDLSTNKVHFKYNVSQFTFSNWRWKSLSVSLREPHVYTYKKHQKRVRTTLCGTSKDVTENAWTASPKITTSNKPDASSNQGGYDIGITKSDKEGVYMKILAGCDRICLMRSTKPVHN